MSQSSDPPASSASEPDQATRHTGTGGAARDALARTRGLDEDLVFRPQDPWFSDVPLIDIDRHRQLTVTRGTLTDAERVHIAGQQALSGIYGVFTNNLGQTELHWVGEVFVDDPRDLSELAAEDVFVGDDLTQFAAHLRHLAQRLDEAAAAGWVLCSMEPYGIAMTDAPLRVSSAGPQQGGEPA